MKGLIVQAVLKFPLNLPRKLVTVNIIFFKNMFIGKVLYWIVLWEVNLNMGLHWTVYVTLNLTAPDAIMNWHNKVVCFEISFKI